MKTTPEEIPDWMCAPTYRDALVFYNSNNATTATLNICLSCEYMAIQEFQQVNADIKVYKYFRNFFKKIGHKVES